MSKEVESPQETEVEEVDPLSVIEMLEESLATALQSLRRIERMNAAALMVGGPNNKDFGKAYKKAFEKAQKEAAKTLNELVPERNE